MHPNVQRTNTDKTYAMRVTFPGDVDYIPPVRKLVADFLQANAFDAKFAFRSEVIIDEICNNAVTYGCLPLDANVELQCRIGDDQAEFIIKDRGGKEEDVRNLKAIIEHGVLPRKIACQDKQGIGLEIVRMLSERIDLTINPENITTIHIVKKKDRSKDIDHA